ncbi:hypothetical protein [Oceanobacter mangrovi]|uniref:hypothetical protein n=1 Tax=Oceanobacter mangrovi TaxID=2862510 RepID=UPI001C8DC2C2|nr:hypothetical protein [Oceanobacter mangrovi]
MFAKTEDNSGRTPFPEHAAAEPDPITQSLLNQSLRQQLMQLNSAEIPLSERLQQLRQSFASLTRHLITGTQVAYKELLQLHEQAYEQAMMSLQQARLAEEVLTNQFVHAHGLVLSPLNCSRTIKDVSRIGAFGLGLHQLIGQQLENQSSIHILYPACGPFAPLLLPLLSSYQAEGLYSAEQIQVTLIDIHSGATQALKQLVDDLGLQDFVRSVVTADACFYEPSAAVDILLLEASHHGFSREAHFSIAKQLLPSLKPEGAMVPSRITVKAALVKGQQEFVEQWRESNVDQPLQLSADALADRIELGDIWRLDRHSILDTQVLTLADGQQVAGCNTLAIPADRDDLAQRVLVIYSEFDTFGDGRLDQYLSGITHPRPDLSVCIDFVPRSSRPDDLLLKAGDSIAFFYRLTGLTGFMPLKAGG